MKALLLTEILSMGVAHTGAFLQIWELPHVENHITIYDLGRKLNNVFKWEETANSLRIARGEAREENYALYKATPAELAKRKAQALSRQ